MKFKIHLITYWVPKTLLSIYCANYITTSDNYSNCLLSPRILHLKQLNKILWKLMIGIITLANLTLIGNILSYLAQLIKITGVNSSILLGIAFK